MDSWQPLPPLTVGLIWVSDFMRAYALYCLVLLVAGVMSSRRLLQHPGRRSYGMGRIHFTLGSIHGQLAAVWETWGVPTFNEI